MSNLIFAADVDRSLIDQFSSEGAGLPDQTMLNPKGERDPSELERIIGMTRAIRRREQANVKPGLRVMDFHATSCGRLKLLLQDLFNAQQRLLKKSKSIAGFHRDAPINLSCSRGKLQFSRHLQRYWTK
ncbi:hypothetical protein LU676_31540, partial [Pseudomonas alloputida]|uniref:hypothetical protein n=1 Tax=Pseudomonas alloputida TaxID=1940621 RepID=UPI001E5B05DE